MPEAVIVLDASVALAWLLDEPPRAVLEAMLLGPPEAAAMDVCVPDHFWLEITNVLTRRYRLKAAEVAASLRDLDDLGLRTVALDRPLLLVAVDLMARLGLTAYDAAYLALAETLDAPLITLDAALVAAGGERVMALAEEGRPQRLAEPATRYGEGTPLAAWTGFDAYLAELRRRLSISAPIAAGASDE